MKKRKIFIFLLTVVLVCVFFPVKGIAVRADKPIVIVIDPGHGGENRGGEYGEYMEKEINPVVAKAMKEELEKYEGVIVYLTHETDTDMSIKDRALFAAEKNADFLFCLHFNMSGSHDLFGAEVWVPATGSYYSQAFAFAQIQMQELTGLGLYSRGIKTRLNNRDENYYGILRYCTQEGVPAALIEHCHLDHPNDQPFYQKGEEQLKAFGILDATAAAKYFRLKSDVLGVDYSDYPVPEVPLPKEIVRPDETEPEICSIELLNVDKATGEVTFSMDAKDQDNYILYYDYSWDGGVVYSELNPWPRPEVWNHSLDNEVLTVTVPFDRLITLMARAYNGFDLYTESNQIVLDAIPDPERLKREAELAAREKAREQEEALRKKQESYRDIKLEEPDAVTEDFPLPLLGILAVILFAMVFVSFFMARKIDLLLKGKRKR